MVKAIIFDLQGTLMENGVFPSPSKQLKRILRINDQFHSYILRFEKTFMTKKYESLTEAFNAVCEEFKIRVPDFVIEKLVGVWNKNKLLSKLFPDTIDALIEFKKEYKLILVANIDCFSTDLIERFELEKYFDAIVLSCNSGKLKSDADFYESVLTDLGIEKSDVLLVGDSLESDIESGKNAGIATVLIDRQDRREYQDKILNLSELNKFL